MEHTDQTISLTSLHGLYGIGPWHPQIHAMIWILHILCSLCLHLLKKFREKHLLKRNSGLWGNFPIAKSYVQSLNSLFRTPFIGVEPKREKRESRITCMRMRQIPTSPLKSGFSYILLLLGCPLAHLRTDDETYLTKVYMKYMNSNNTLQSLLRKGWWSLKVCTQNVAILFIIIFVFYHDK